MLARSQALGFLGPGPVERHVAHGRALLTGLPETGRVLDLGSGGGLPGLVIAAVRPALHLTLLEARQRACRFLREAISVLALPQVEVVEARAEEAARRRDLRETYDAVVSRSFGPPAVTAECAVAFLREAAALVVTEPPSEQRPASGGVQGSQGPPWGAVQATRWPEEGLASLGFAPAILESSVDATFVVLTKVRCDERWPRRTGIPAKRPLWKVS